VELRLEYSQNGSQEILAKKRVLLKDFPNAGEWHSVVVEGVACTDGIRAVIAITPSLDEIPRAGAVKFDDALLEIQE